MTQLFILIINIYQKLLSPDHSYWSKYVYPYGFCRMHPTCSEYAKLCLLQFGVFYAVPKIIIRLARCNPFASPRIELIK